MKPLVTVGIVLSRTDFGEADRIITMLTPDHGKLRLMARGVRKLKSKLAGGIELFSVNHITFIEGKGDIGTLISSRLQNHYGGILSDIDRVQQGYDFLKLLNKATEDQPEAAYFELLRTALASLDDGAINLYLINLWFEAQLLQLAGHTPNLTTDTNDRPLNTQSKYKFDFEAMAFTPAARGGLAADHIKALRLLFSPNPPAKLAKVDGLDEVLKQIAPVLRAVSSSVS